MNEPKKISAVNHEAPEFLDNYYDENNLYQVENKIIDDTNKKIDWRKRTLEYKISYMIENRNEVIYIHNNKVNDIYKYSLLHDIINPPKRPKNINSHYSHIVHWCINIRKVKAKFKNIWILLDSGCSSTILMRRLVGKLSFEKYAVI